MHQDDGRNHNSSQWSINSDPMLPSTSEGYSIVNGMISSCGSLPSSSILSSHSIPTQLSFLPNRFDFFTTFHSNLSLPVSCPSSSSIDNQLIQNELIHQQNIVRAAFNSSVASSSLFSSIDSQSILSSLPYSSFNRSSNEIRRTSLPAVSISMESLPSTAYSDMPILHPSINNEQPIDNEEPKTEEKSEKTLAEALAAHEEFRSRPAPIVEDTYPRAPTPTDYGQLPTQGYLPSHFFKGTVIQLSNGIQKTVEEMNTFDFIQCAASSIDMTMETSVIDLIEKNDKTFRISASVERAQLGEIDVTPEHPFFVIGKGWSSCDPEKTNRIYGLKASLLTAGDCCISLLSSEYETEETGRCLDCAVGIQEAAQEALDEVKLQRIYERVVSRSESNRKRGHCDRERNKSEPPQEIDEKRIEIRRRRCQSMDPHLETHPPIPKSKPFNQFLFQNPVSPKSGFDFAI